MAISLHFISVVWSYINYCFLKIKIKPKNTDFELLHKSCDRFWRIYWPNDRIEKHKTKFIDPDFEQSFDIWPIFQSNLFTCFIFLLLLLKKTYQWFLFPIIMNNIISMVCQFKSQKHNNEWLKMKFLDKRTKKREKQMRRKKQQLETKDSILCVEKLNVDFKKSPCRKNLRTSLKFNETDDSI